MQSIGFLRLAVGITLGGWASAHAAEFGALPAGAPGNSGGLQISELYYNPPGTNGLDGEVFEFLELRNTAAEPVPIGGYYFEGISASFAYPRVLAPGGFLVLVRDPVHFAERFPGVTIDGSYGGKLDNGGERICLLDTEATVILDVTYNDLGAWPAEADGRGASLQRVNTSPDGNFPFNWRAYPPTPGAPLPQELVDTDGDGMTDVWEQAHGLNVTDRTDAAQDPDGDRMSNVEEFGAGTDPHDATQNLQFSSIRLELTPRYRIAVLEFPAMAGRSYSLYMQIGNDDCWSLVDTVPARETNRVETLRHVIYPGFSPVFYHLGTPAGSPPPCEDGAD